MSYQRAIINCERCYGLAKHLKERSPGNSEETHFINILQNDQIYAVRNEALKTLEDSTVSVKGKTEELVDTHAAMKYNADIWKALNKCLDCKFEQPEIANYLRKELKEK